MAALDKAMAFIEGLEKKYGQPPVLAYLCGKMTTGDRVSYEIITELYDVG